MVARASHPAWTVADYLVMERTSSVRHEYIDGAVYALAGGTRAHSRLTVNLTTLLSVALSDGPCQVYSSDMRVQVTPTRYVYPDVSVSCAAADQGVGSAVFLTAPCLVVEVVSTSTEEYDRGGKFDFYRQVPSIRDYLLVETARPLVERRSRGADGTWTIHQYGPGATFDLPSLGIQLAVDRIYARVDVDDDTPPPTGGRQRA
jgi:Uma2 family endonuclease